MAYLTLLTIYQLQPLYNNHSHNHRKYKGLSSINIKDFLRQDKKFIMIEYKHYDQFSQLYNHYAYRKYLIKIQLNHCYLERVTQHPCKNFATHRAAGMASCYVLLLFNLSSLQEDFSV